MDIIMGDMDTTTVIIMDMVMDMVMNTVTDTGMGTDMSTRIWMKVVTS